MKKYLVMMALLAALTLSAAENGMGRSGEFVWNELATKDVKAAKDFYGKVFGWEFVDKKMDNMTYTMIKKGGNEFGGIWAIPTEQQGQIPPHWLSYISVDNLDQALEKTPQNGGTVLKPAQKVGDMGSFAIIKDPTGATVAVWQNAQ